MFLNSIRRCVCKRIFNKLIVPEFQKYNCYSTNSDIVKSPCPDIVIPNTPMDEVIIEKFSNFAPKVAVECAVTGRKVTFEEILKKSTALANFLHKFNSLQQGDTIAIVLPNVPEYPIIFLGAALAGIKISTFNPDSTASEISRQLQDSQSKLVFTLTNLWSKVDQAVRALQSPNPAGIVTIEHEERRTHLEENSINFSEIIEGNDKLSFTLSKSMEDLFILPYSSGTTGLPKGVELTNKNIIACYHQMQAEEISHYINEDDICLGVLPMFHIFGMIPQMLNMLTYGTKVVTVPKFEPNIFINILENHRPTFGFLVPPLVLMLANHPGVKAEHISRMKMVSGAAPLTEFDIHKVREKAKTDIVLLQGYGLTETSSVISCQTGVLPHGLASGGSGLCMRNTELKVTSLDDPNKLVGPNQKGELVVRGPQIMKGYHNNPEATAEVIDSEGWFKTGDIGYYDENGHIFVTDRLKELIKVKGFQVAPAELEGYIKEYPGIVDVAVVGVPHNTFGEVPKAFITAKKGATIDPAKIKEYIAKKVSKHKQLLGGVVVINNIPKSASGKILRRELQQL